MLAGMQAPLCPPGCCRRKGSCSGMQSIPGRDLLAPSSAQSREGGNSRGLPRGSKEQDQRSRDGVCETNDAKVGVERKQRSNAGILHRCPALPLLARRVIQEESEDLVQDQPRKLENNAGRDRQSLIPVSESVFVARVRVCDTPAGACTRCRNWMLWAGSRLAGWRSTWGP